jgi:hypothetical protein
MIARQRDHSGETQREREIEREREREREREHILVCILRDGLRGRLLSPEL